MSTKHCTRCGGRIGDPVEENASYIRSDDFSVVVDDTKLIAFVHTDETIAELQRLQEEEPRMHPENISQMLLDGNIESEVTRDDFEIIEVEDPQRAAARDDVVRIEEVAVEREEMKTGLVHRGECVEEDDMVIW